MVSRYKRLRVGAYLLILSFLGVFPSRRPRAASAIARRRDEVILNAPLLVGRFTPKAECHTYLEHVSATWQQLQRFAVTLDRAAS